MIRIPRIRFAVTILLLVAGFDVCLAQQKPRQGSLPAPFASADQLAQSDQASHPGGAKHLGPPTGYNPPVPVQHPELDDYIQRVGEEDFDTLVKNLNQHENVLVAPYSGGMQSEWAFHRCLNNRRLAKIYLELASLPAAEADRLTREIFATKFQKYRTDLVHTLDSDNERKPPKGTGNPSDNLNAVYGAVFLSAVFCPVSEVLRELEEWEESGQSLDPRAEGIDDPRRKLMTQIELRWARPESLFLLNIYACMLRDRCADTDFEKLLPKGLPTQTVAFGAWDEKPRSFSFGHRGEVEPVVARPHLKTLNFHPGWDCFPGHHTIIERNRKILEQFRERLEACAASETD